MRPTPRWFPGLLALLALVSFDGALRAQDGHGGHADQDLGKLFAQKCGGCHAAPDLGFATDKAWLGQVLETA